MEIFRAVNLSKQFSQKFVLDNFSFVVNQGDKIFISGHSGIGKSTLFKLLLGFEQPQKGEIYFKGEKVTTETLWKIRKEVAYIPQSVEIGSGSVSSLFMETLSYKANSRVKQNIDSKISDFFLSFGLSEGFLSKNIEDLSGGEKQRIAIVNSLILERKIFLLDEITSALDVELKEKVLDYFLNNKEFTVLFISHDSYIPEDYELKTIKLD